jgi:hypothetical protein
MPLRVNVGLSKKVGEENFGSRGASVNLELELDSNLANEPGKLQDKIRQLFGLVRTSLTEELNGASNGHASAAATNGAAAKPPANTRRATQSQIKALHAIAKDRRLDLGSLLNERFRVNRPDDLSIKQASELISSLQGATQEGRER